METYKLSEMKRKNFSEATNKIYLLTDYNHAQYPGYCNWFYTKSIPRTINHTGDIIFYLDGFQIVGLANLKKTDDEKKICTFFINEEYRKKGYSKLILEDAYKYLETSTPLITIPKKDVEQFNSIINAYDWKESRRTDDYLSEEIIFNEKVLRR